VQRLRLRGAASTAAQPTYLVIEMPLGILAYAIVGAVKCVDLTPVGHTSCCQKGGNVHRCTHLHASTQS
jgi:hypothetical protein